MGQKINPISLRIQSSTRYFDQAWYSDYFFSKLLSIDLSVFQYLNAFLKSFKLPLGRFSIYHLPKTTKIYNFFCYPKQSRDTKSKMFNISSGLPNLKTKKYIISEKGKMQKRNALMDENLFQQIVVKKNANEFLVSPISSKFLYSLLKMKLNTLFPVSTLNSLVFVNNMSTEKAFQIPEHTEHMDLHMKYAKEFTNYVLHTVLEDKNIIKKKSSNKKDKIIPIFKEILNVSAFLKKADSEIPQTHLRLSESNPSFINTPLKYNTQLQTNLSKFLNFDVTLIPFQSNYEWQDAGYFADEIVFLLERRISFRQIKNKILKQLGSNPFIQGVRITCSGRVGGKSKKAQRARIDSVKYGQTSLNVFSAQIDFAVRTAYTALGSTGVKVWICYKY